MFIEDSGRDEEGKESSGMMQWSSMLGQDPSLGAVQQR
jgi:hypothetical protein